MVSKWIECPMLLWGDSRFATSGSSLRGLFTRTTLCAVRIGYYYNVNKRGRGMRALLERWNERNEAEVGIRAWFKDIIPYASKQDDIKTRGGAAFRQYVKNTKVWPHCRWPMGFNILYTAVWAVSIARWIQSKAQNAKQWITYKRNFDLRLSNFQYCKREMTKITYRRISDFLKKFSQGFKISWNFLNCLGAPSCWPVKINFGICQRTDRLQRIGQRCTRTRRHTAVL